MEERDSKGQTPFHVALVKGNLATLRYLFESHPPDDDAMMYASPPGTDNLTLALESRVPETFWMVLDNKLASADDRKKVWDYITSSSGKNAVLETPGLQKGEEMVNVGVDTTIGDLRERKKGIASKIQSPRR